MKRIVFGILAILLVSVQFAPAYAGKTPVFVIMKQVSPQGNTTYINKIPFKLSVYATSGHTIGEVDAMVTIAKNNAEYVAPVVLQRHGHTWEGTYNVCKKSQDVKLESGPGSVFWFFWTKNRKFTKATKVTATFIFEARC